MNRANLRDIPIRLAPPTPVPTVPDIPDGEPNLLPKSALLADLRVEFPLWEGAVTDPADPGDTLYLYWDGVEVDRKLFTAADVIPDHFFMTVPRARLTGDGEHQLQYVAYNSVGNPVGSQPAPVWIDTVEPGHNDVLLPLQPDPGVPGDIVNDAYLAANGDQLLARVPAYMETRVGDVIHGFWQPDLLPEQDVADSQMVVDQQAIDAGEIALVFSGQTIRQKGNGRTRVWYRITDRAGNVSAHSDDRQWLVDLLTPPTSLLLPAIPQANDGLIDRADACDKVFIVLGGYSVPTQGDQLLVRFNSNDLAPFPAPGVGGFPLSVEVPWDVLRAYGETAPYQAVVHWRVQRGAFISPPSQTLTVDVDLRIPGPANSSPCPLNLMLPAVRVKGRTGDNVIVLEDAPGPVRVEVALYSGASSPQLMTLYWGALANPVATYQVTPGDTPGITVAFEVPWDAIIAVGSDPALPVCYTVSNGVNLQQSPETLCRVDIAVQDATLPLPRYPQPPSYQSPPRWDERIANYNCSARAWAGITLYIPADARFVDGSRMVVHWKGYAGRNLSSPIDGLEADFELRLDATAATQGVTFVIGPEHFQRLVLPLSYRGIDDVGQGSADAWYTLYRPGLPAIYNLHPENYCTVDLIRPGNICPCTRDDYLSDPPDWCEECDPLVEANCPPAH